MGLTKGHTEDMKVNSVGSVKIAVVLDSELLKQLEVAAGREGATGASEDERLHLVVSLRLVQRPRKAAHDGPKNSGRDGL